MKAKLAFASSMVALLISGCASVPLESEEQSAEAKKFAAPAKGMAGLYVYRDSSLGGALKKNVKINGKCLGESAPYIFFYEQLEGDKEHIVATESEFSDNELPLFMQADENYFVRQYVRPGVFVGGANLEVIPADKAKKAIKELKLARTGVCD